MKKTRRYLKQAVSKRFLLSLLAAILTQTHQVIADVGVNLKLWRGYNTFYDHTERSGKSPTLQIHGKPLVNDRVGMTSVSSGYKRKA